MSERHFLTGQLFAVFLCSGIIKILINTAIKWSDVVCKFSAEYLNLDLLIYVGILGFNNFQFHFQMFYIIGQMTPLKCSRSLFSKDFVLQFGFSIVLLGFGHVLGCSPISHSSSFLSVNYPQCLQVPGLLFFRVRSPVLLCAAIFLFLHGFCNVLVNSSLVFCILGLTPPVPDSLHN